VSSKATEELQELVRLLPRPLGLVLGSAAAADAVESPVLQVHRLLGGAEGAIKFLLAVAVGVQSQQEAGQSPLAREAPARVAMGHWGVPDLPTFNDWAQALGSVLKSQPELLGELQTAAAGWRGLVQRNDPGWLRGAREPSSGVLGEFVRTDQAWWVQMRNVLAHSAGLTPNRARELVAQLLPPYLKATRLLSTALAEAELVSWQEGRAALVPRGVEAAGLLELGPEDRLSRLVAVERERLGRTEEVGLYLVWAAGGRGLVELWPLLLVGGASRLMALGEDQGLRTASNVFWRVLKGRPEYDPHGDEAVVRVGGAAELQSYRSRFRAEEQRKSDFQGFWAEVELEAGVFAGREELLAGMLEAVADLQDSAWGLRYLVGQAGRGKSALMARLAWELIQKAGETDGRSRSVVYHRFQALDARNSGRAFVELALRQLRGKVGDEKLAELGMARDALVEELQRQRPLLLVDGLDELERAESGAVKELLKLAQKGGLWLLSTRPGLEGQLLEAGAQRLALGGQEELPRLQEADVREIILARGPRLVREELLTLDEEAAEKLVSNQLLKNLIKVHGNEPQYLMVWLEYLAGLESREQLVWEVVAAADRRAPKLPKGIEELHEKLLVELGPGEVTQYKTWAMYMLAQARAPLTAGMLAELYWADAAGAEEVAVRIPHFERVLQLYGMVLESARDADGFKGVRIEYTSFRDHLEGKHGADPTWQDAARHLARGGRQPGGYPKSERHLYRHGIHYLLAAGRQLEAVELFRSGDYRLAALRRLRVGEDPEPGADVLVADHRLLVAALKDEPHLAGELARLALATLEQELTADHPCVLTAKYNVAITLLSIGEWVEARNLEEEVLEAYRHRLGDEHPATLQAKHNLALILSHLGELHRARLMQEEVLQTSRQVLGEEHPETLQAKNNLAVTLGELDERREAHRLFLEVEGARRRLLGESHPDTLSAKHNLAATLADLGESLEARNMQEEVVDVSRRLLGEAHPDTLSAKHQLALMVFELGDLPRARLMQEEVLQTSRQVLGEEHPETLKAKNNLSLTLRALGELLQANVLLEELVAVTRRRWGENHAETLAAKDNLALTLKDLRQLRAARALQQDVLEARRTLLGEAHSDTLLAKRNLAFTLKDLGQLGEAHRLQEEVLEGSRRLFGEDHPQTLLDKVHVARTLALEAGELREAQRLFFEVVEARRRLLGEQHPDTLSAKHDLALTLRDLGDLAEAQRQLEQVLEVSRRVLGEEHTETLRAERNLAVTVRELDDRVAAKRLMEQSLEVFRLLSGEEHPDTLAAKTNLARTLRDLGDLAEARRLLEQVLEVKGRVLGQEHAETLRAKGNLAVTLRELDDLDGAKRLLEQCLEEFRLLSGEEHADTLTAKTNLAQTLFDLGDLAEARRLEEQVLEVNRRVLGDEHWDTLTAKRNLAITLLELGEPMEARRLQDEVLAARNRYRLL
jgi:hypothetical protein